MSDRREDSAFLAYFGNALRAMLRLEPIYQDGEWKRSDPGTADSNRRSKLRTKERGEKDRSSASKG